MDVPSASPILFTIMSMQTASSFFDYFKLLSTVQRNAIFPYIKYKLPHLIKNSYDFFLVFSCLDRNQQSQILNNYKGMIVLIKNFSNFYDIFNALIPVLRFKLITFFIRKGKVSLLSDDISKLYLIILRFERKDRFLVLSMLNSEGKVSSLFGNLPSVQRFLDYFEPSDYLVVLNELNKEGKINTLLNFKDTSSVIMFLKKFPTIDRLEVFKVLLTIKETAILFGKEASFQAIFNAFGSNFHLSLADGLQKNLIINTADKFIMFFKQLKIDDSVEFVSMISSALSSIDETGKHCESNAKSKSPR
ncbi:hypothetical protein [Rickettsiella endosymbiont of Dermanyssus gallinae]|uniref:hypothetical protein n=1 Tax=Rickettsiella endosymbiont of Dermanyssus gallinae TaxID=2856608 RepID=UPI001C52C6CE|nr:hypothetical protein [Rickettsiella endosymbiont of Dermanyssus gallinae]